MTACSAGSRPRWHMQRRRGESRGGIEPSSPLPKPDVPPSPEGRAMCSEITNRPCPCDGAVAKGRKKT